MKTNATTTSVTPSFRMLLQEHLARLCAANPRYSLRAFARRLRVDHATLSQLMRGRRVLTSSMIERLGRRLGLDQETIAAHVASEPVAVRPIDGTTREVQQLTRDAVNLISDWQHYAILELVRLKGFEPDTRWIARVLGITPDAVNTALARLLHLNLLKMVAPDRWVDQCGDTRASFAQFTRVTIARLFEQVRNLSQAAVERVPAHAQAHSTTTIAVRSSRVREATALIATFQRQLVNVLESDADRDDVYQLEVHFYPVTTLQQSRTSPPDTEN